MCGWSTSSKILISVRSCSTSGTFSFRIAFRANTSPVSMFWHLRTTPNDPLPMTPSILYLLVTLFGYTKLKMLAFFILYLPNWLLLSFWLSFSLSLSFSFPSGDDRWSAWPFSASIDIFEGTGSRSVGTRTVVWIECFCTSDKFWRQIECHQTTCTRTTCGVVWWIVFWSYYVCSSESLPVVSTKYNMPSAK